MSIRSFATMALAAASLAAPMAAASGTPAQAVTTTSCYQLDVAPYDGVYTLISYQQQIELDAKGIGATTRASYDGSDIMVCGDAYAIRSRFTSNPAVSSMSYVPVRSTADATFRISLPSSSLITIPERSPYYLASELAMDNGLTVLHDSADRTANTIVVQGNPATVYDLWTAWRITPLAA